MLMLRIAAQNISRRSIRSALLGLSVMMAVGVGFASFAGGWGLQTGIATSFSRMGADIVVVPSGTLVNLTSTLLTVQPTEKELDASLGEQLRGIPGVGIVTPQRVVRAQADGRVINLIAIDPRTDFTVLPWLPASTARVQELNDGIVIGDRVTDATIGGAVTICGRSLPVTARLGHTGVGPFDDSYFVSFATLDALIEAWKQICHAAGIDISAVLPKKAEPPVDSSNAVHQHQVLSGPASCLPVLAPGKVSAFLIQVAPGASVDQVMFAIGQIPNIRQIAGNPVFTSTRQALSLLFEGGVVVASLILLGLLIVISLLFSAIVQERYRELGLLRAMGARPGQIMRMIISEAATVTLLGGIFGIGAGVAMVFAFARTLGFYFESLGVPFSWPPSGATLGGAAVAIILSAALGFIGALLPAWRACRLEPYVMIKGGSAS